MKVVAQSNTALRVSWSDLPVEEARGKITQYKVMYRLKDYPSFHVIQLDKGNVREYTITGT